MNKLFPAAQAIRFLSGCHVICNNLDVKSQEKSLLEFSCPENSNGQLVEREATGYYRAYF